MWVGRGAQLDGGSEGGKRGSEVMGKYLVHKAWQVPLAGGVWAGWGRRVRRTQLRHVPKETKGSRKCLRDIFYIEPLFLAALHPTHFY